MQRTSQPEYYQGKPFTHLIVYSAYVRGSDGRAKGLLGEVHVTPLGAWFWPRKGGVGRKVYQGRNGMSFHRWYGRKVNMLLRVRPAGRKIT